MAVAERDVGIRLKVTFCDKAKRHMEETCPDGGARRAILNGIYEGEETDGQQLVADALSAAYAGHKMDATEPERETGSDGQWSVVIAFNKKAQTGLARLAGDIAIWDYVALQLNGYLGNKDGSKGNIQVEALVHTR